MMRRLAIGGVVVLAPVMSAAIVLAPTAAAEIRQTAPCAIADAAPGVDLRVVPPSLDFQQLWQFTRGAGQRVAVIDTGVTPNPRLRNLTAGGDLVGGGDGLDDCDAHGTLVAGIIAAAPDPGDGFSGVAPDAEIISIRQSSGKFSDYGAFEGSALDGAAPDGSGSVRTLAQAIGMATAAGATIINISEVACTPGPGGVRSESLEAAIDGALARDIVIVVAAGNTQGGSGAGCQQNPTQIDPLDPLSKGHEQVRTVVAPASIEGKVLTVGSVEQDGSPSEFSVAGPWLSVAAPGSRLISLANSRDGGLAVQIRTERGVGAISGTSFSAPYVAGLAALIRARHPHLSAPEVIERIIATATPAPHGWDPVVGYGVVNPVAALGFELSGQNSTATAESTISAPAVVAPEDPAPRRRALIGVAVCAALLGLGTTGAAALRRADSRT